MQTHRRQFLSLAAAGLASISSTNAAQDLVAGVDLTTLKQGRTGGEPTWFHPRACLIPTAGPQAVFMTLQTIAGSDYYGPVHSMTSLDAGKTWTVPELAPPLGRIKQADSSEEGVCDVVPEWHTATQSVLAVGHNVYYKGPRFHTDQPSRGPIYAVWKNGQWGPRQRLLWNNPLGRYIYTNGCGQRVTLPNGNILLALSFTSSKATPRAVASALCSFDGITLAIKQTGPMLEHSHGRGLLEPSLVRYRDRFLMTIRAEDQRGYVTTSDDGLHWQLKQPWTWDNGEPLTMSTTQQHWLPHGEALYLVYNRRHDSNLKVFRWRSPLFMAQVDLATLRLRRDTERIVIPLKGDGLKQPDDVPNGGNFHTNYLNEHESWITDGQVLPKRGFQGDLLLARVRWSQPNRLP
jgi:hypothetical protein